ncbi:MAG: endolytic transglycosylase MltG [Gammaproteobacteria bacterium]|nr:endolytic transglycosylase MltG [Gammaproteobacteria bacterium]
MFRRLTGLMALLLTLAVAVSGWVLWLGNAPVSAGEETFVVRPGQSVRQVAMALAERSLLEEPRALIVWAHLRGDAGRIRAGEYRIESGNVRQLLDQLVSGAVVAWHFTLVEGWTFAQLRKALAAEDKLKNTLGAEISDAELMKRLGRAGLHPEGRFFPDTYQYTRGTPDQALLERAAARMDAVLAELWPERAPGLPLETPYEALILASIVEKETGLATERPLIAGVFINRLRRNMRLQTDPTVIYGLGAAFDGNLRRRDLEADTPYNTYTRTGLPPTPIALAGREAIVAVLHPADTKALYFVARGDGSHEFSQTLEQHNEAVIQFQLKGRRRPFSSFPPATPGSGT